MDVITVDDRVGSADLCAYLPPALARLGRLEYGDVAFTGNGSDREWLVGVERKAIRDLINSMVTGRLAGHQLVGMFNVYDVVYLIVEGMWKPDKNTGALMIWRAGNWQVLSQGGRVHTYRDILCYLNTLSVMCGLKIVQTSTPRETAEAILSLHHWWTAKEWDDHRAHVAMDESQTVVLVKQSLVRRIAAQLPGIGWKRSAAVAKYAGSVVSMCTMTEKDWCSIEGIGKVTAQKVMKSLQQEGG